MDRLINYLFAFVLIGLFVLKATPDDQVRMIVALFLSGIICFTAFLLRWLTLGGAKAAFMVGAYTYGLGGFPAALIVIVFFLTGSALSKINGVHRWNSSEYNHFETRRNGLQVWANSFWFTLFLGLFYFTQQQLWLLAATTAIAAATADTWATEIGTYGVKRKAVLILDFKPVRVGENGGVSIKGTVSGFLGSMIIAFTYMLIAKPAYGILFLAVTLAGFLGCVIDSYLGAIFQFKGKPIYVPGIMEHRYFLENNGVNFTSIGLSSLTVIILYEILKMTHALV